MPTVIAVRHDFSVIALLAIKDQQFAQQYGLGVWWAMFGDEQGNGPYEDMYVVDNISRNIQAGRFSSPQSPWLSHVGFYLGMLHGGWLVKPSDNLVILTDQDFTKGYHVGRNYCFTEAAAEGRVFSDRLLIEAITSWAAEYPTWQEPEATLRYVLGCRIGELSGAVLPLQASELTFEGAVNTAPVRI